MFLFAFVGWVYVCLFVCAAVCVYMCPQSGGDLVKDQCCTSNVYFLRYPAPSFPFPGEADPISSLSEGILDNRLRKQARIKVFRSISLCATDIDILLSLLDWTFSFVDENSKQSFMLWFNVHLTSFFTPRSICAWPLFNHRRPHASSHILFCQYSSLSLIILSDLSPCPYAFSSHSVLKVLQSKKLLYKNYFE